MRGLVLGALTLVTISFGGCLDGPAPAAVTEGLDADSLALPILVGPGGESRGTDPLGWAGSYLASGEVQRILFDVSFPDGYWDAHTGGLEFSVSWDHRSGVYIEMQVFSEDGRLLGTGDWGWVAQTVILDRPASGTYRVEVKALDGFGMYSGVVQVESRAKDAPVRELLPNLVALQPTELRISMYHPFPVNMVANQYGARGCSEYEMVEHQAKKCLRFTNRVGNAGEGSFTLHLNLPESAKSVAGQGQWVQRIWQSDGTFRDVAVGKAEFHPTHAHAHYAGMAGFQVFRYDVDTQTRGEPVSEGRKTGFFFADHGLVALGLPGTTPPYACDEQEGWTWPASVAQGPWNTCLSPNWYDIYHWSLDDQYVDVSRLPDGVYELVTTSNAVGSVHETTKDDNSSSVVFELVGDEVRVPKDQPGAAKL